MSMNKLAMFMLANGSGNGGSLALSSGKTLVTDSIGGEKYIRYYVLNNIFFVNEDSIGGVYINSDTPNEMGMYKIWDVANVDTFILEGKLNCIYYYYTDDSYTESDYHQGTVVFKNGCAYLLTDEDITNFSDRCLFVECSGLLIGRPNSADTP